MPLDNPAFQEAWKTPILVNSWANYGTPYNAIGYWKDSLGVVHLRGVLKDGVVNQIMFTLPIGYRPANIEALTSWSYNVAQGFQVGRVDIYSNNGGVLLQSGVSGVVVALFLDGMTFRAI